MGLLNDIVAYWYDCIKNEDILEKDISINVRSKAVLYPFDDDLFVFDRSDNPVIISGDEKLTTFSEYIATQGYESYYGYPVLFYFDDKEQKYLIAPLFIIKVKFVRESEGLYLQKDEPNPTCGIQAFSKLGFRTEEIADISRSLEDLFRSHLYDKRELTKRCLDIIQKETDIQAREDIDPTALTNSKKLSKNMTAGLYNKSLVFAGENTVYNINLLQDLRELKGKNDLDKTALSFILERVSSEKGGEKIPVLPFPSNEYQVKALQDIFQNKLSVITGPPGTGKSQFISNLLINLFLEGKSVLFVSHTNNAVDVVNEKVNKEFRNLLMRTGSKEFRQELKGKFNDIILASSKIPPQNVQMNQIHSSWQTILKYRRELLEIDRLEEQFQNDYLSYKDRKALFYEDLDLEQSFQELSPNLRELGTIKDNIENLKFNLDKLEKEFNNCYLTYYSKRNLFYNDLDDKYIDVEDSFSRILPKFSNLEIIINQIKDLKFKIEKENFNWWEKVILFFLPNFFNVKKEWMFFTLIGLLPQKVLKILRLSNLNQYLELLNLFSIYTKVETELEENRKKKETMFSDLNHLLSVKILKILQNSSTPEQIRDWNEQGWLRLSEYIELLKSFFKLETIKQKLSTFQSRGVIEQKIRKLEKDFYDASARFVRDIYIQKMLGKGENIGKVNSFLNQVDSGRPTDDSIDSYFFIEALNVLKIWSSTLKSVRKTFPLTASIFDYVIFDEASQVDLPSAAPALYRSKRSIVVGDPMQLTHIAGITRDIDKEIAKAHGLTEKRDIYPSKVRYCDVSLYKSAESSLTHKPVLLINHYRSEDQIIALCNQAFYEGRLKIMTTLDYSRWTGDLPLGVHWVNCAGEVFKHPTGSRINQIEVLSVNNIFKEVLRKISETNLSIGIVTPYSRQQDAIYERISQSTSAELCEKHNVKILTAHKFQGSEKDIMIFSLVLASRGNGNSDRWYNIYPQILNVALSRARYLLYIVGDKNYCHERTGVLKRLVDTYDEIKKQEKQEEYVLHEKFDSPTEMFLFQKLQEVDFEKLGYRLIPKLVVKRYTLDFALLGRKKIDVECDGYQHEIIEGLPVLEDIERDEFLKKEGWEILRFPNHKILSKADRVLEDIVKNL